MSTPDTEIPESQIVGVLQSKGYNLIKQIGAGASARVFLVFSEKYQTFFVTKVMSFLTKQFCSECEVTALRQISSPNVIALYDYTLTPDCLYLFLEFCPHGSLHDYVNRVGPIRNQLLYGMCKGILSGLVDIHSQRFAHLDLKPANILIDRYGRVRLADFGISRLYHGSNLSNQRAGTIAYMAPEVYLLRSYDPFKTDIFSAGVTFFYMAVGRTPWMNTSSAELKREIPLASIQLPRDMNPEFAKLIRMMTVVEPGKRPTAEECLQMPIFADVATKEGFIRVKPDVNTPRRKIGSLPNLQRGRVSSARDLRSRLPVMCANC
jgi:serine/threonine protein kinase